MNWTNRSLIAAVGLLIVAYFLPAAAQTEPSRPIVVLPGIVGSVLEGPDDVYWGDAGALRQFERLMVEDGPREPNDGLRATELIDGIGVLGVALIDQYNLMRDAFRRGRVPKGSYLLRVSL